jgi:hypothetical protein
MGEEITTTIIVFISMIHSVKLAKPFQLSYPQRTAMTTIPTTAKV